MTILRILNLQYIPDPIPYLHKQKLRAMSLPDDYIYNLISLITPSGVKMNLAENITNEQFINLIQEILDVTYDATTEWADLKNLYAKTTYH